MSIKMNENSSVWIFESTRSYWKFSFYTNKLKALHYGMSCVARKFKRWRFILLASALEYDQIWNYGL